MTARFPVPVLPFRKLHGLGNDFVLFDGISRALPVGALTDPARVVALCDRHRGIGADGVLLLLPPTDAATAHARMRVLNADGSEPETCGNGIRCAVKVLRERVAACANLEAVLVETGAGIARCTPRIEDARVVAVRVDMGPPSLERARVGLGGSGRFLDEELEVQGLRLRATAVSLGNPHLVTFVDDPHTDLHALALRLGPLVEHHAALAHGANAGFARRDANGRRLELCVWERGAGLTQACGSGACAAAVAARATGRVHSDDLVVALPGGELRITVAADLSRVWMEGAVEEVFAGEIGF